MTPPALTHLQPDTADNYEIGTKGTVTNRIRYSAAIYDIQWHNIQEGVQLTPLVLPASLNIGEAYSRGVELEVSASVTRHLAAQLGYTYDLTKLTSLNPLFTFPNVSVPPPAIGSPLPGTPKSSLAAGLRVRGPAAGWGAVAVRAQRSLPKSGRPGAFRDRADGALLLHAGYPLELGAIAFHRHAIHQQSHQQPRHLLVYRPLHLRQPLSSGGIDAAHGRIHAGIFVQRTVNGRPAVMIRTGSEYLDSITRYPRGLHQRRAREGSWPRIRC